MNVTRRRFLSSAAAAGVAMSLNDCTSAAERSAGQDPITFAVVADTHLGKAPEAIPGKPTDGNPARWLADAVAEINASPAEFTVFLGDLVENGGKNEEQYPRWVEIVSNLRRPYYAIAGNHDPEPLFLKYVRPVADYEVDRPGLRLVLFNDSSPETHDGVLRPAQTSWVAARIDEAARAGRRVILCGHIPRHPNGPPDMGWYIRTREKECLDWFTRSRGTVVAMLSGHLHLGLRAWNDAAGVHELVLPSACWNFNRDLRQAPGFSSDERRRGYALLTLSGPNLTVVYKPIGAPACPPLVLTL